MWQLYALKTNANLIEKPKRSLFRVKLVTLIWRAFLLADQVNQWWFCLLLCKTLCPLRKDAVKKFLERGDVKLKVNLCDGVANFYLYKRDWLCSHVDVYIMILGVGPEARETRKVGDEGSGGCRVEEGDCHDLDSEVPTLSSMFH